MNVTKKSIETFLGEKKLAIAGVSRNDKKFGYLIYKELLSKGFDVYPVNPNTDEINGEKCYRSVADLPEGVTRLLLLTKKNHTLEVLREAHEKGIKDIWIQQKSETPEALNFSAAHFKTIIHKQCIMMHACPVKSVHKFHRNIVGFFGKLPK